MVFEDMYTTWNAELMYSCETFVMGAHALYHDTMQHHVVAVRTCMSWLFGPYMGWDSGSSPSDQESLLLTPAGSSEYQPEVCSPPWSSPPQIQNSDLSTFYVTRWYRELTPTGWDRWPLHKLKLNQIAGLNFYEENSWSRQNVKYVHCKNKRVCFKRERNKMKSQQSCLQLCEPELGAKCLSLT